MLMLQLEKVLIDGGVGSAGHPLQSSLHRRLTLLVLSLAFEVGARSELTRHPNLRQPRLLHHAHTHTHTHTCLSESESDYEHLRLNSTYSSSSVKYKQLDGFSYRVDIVECVHYRSSH